jgi:hypothetical protein
VHFKDVVDLRGQGTRGWAGVLALVKHKERWGSKWGTWHCEREAVHHPGAALHQSDREGHRLAGWWAGPTLFSFPLFFFFPLRASVLLFIRLVRCLGSPHNCLGIWKGVGLHASPYHLKDRSGI